MKNGSIVELKLSKLRIPDYLNWFKEEKQQIKQHHSQEMMMMMIQRGIY